MDCVAQSRSVQRGGPTIRGYQSHVAGSSTSCVVNMTVIARSCSVGETLTDHLKNTPNPWMPVIQYVNVPWPRLQLGTLVEATNRTAAHATDVWNAIICHLDVNTDQGRVPGSSQGRQAHESCGRPTLYISLGLARSRKLTHCSRPSTRIRFRVPMRSSQTVGETESCK